MIAIPKLPDVPEEQRTELVATLLEVIRIQQEALQQLRDEIARLKGQKPKPTIKPSKLEARLAEQPRRCRHRETAGLAEKEQDGRTADT